MCSISQPTPVFLFMIPNEVLIYHIFQDLDAASKVACSLTCARFREILPLRKKCYHTQRAIFCSIFRNGQLNLWLWFQAVLRYPTSGELFQSVHKRLRHDCLENAAEGIISGGCVHMKVNLSQNLSIRRPGGYAEVTVSQAFKKPHAARICSCRRRSRGPHRCSAVGARDRHKM